MSTLFRTSAVAAMALVGLTLAPLAPAYAEPPAGEGHGEKAAAKADPLAKKITGSEAYVPMFGLRSTISRGLKVEGVLSVDAGLDVPQAKSRDRVAAMRPRVLDAMRGAVASYATLSYIAGERPDADMLRARLQKAVDVVLGKDEATVTLASVIVFQQ